MVGHRVTYDFLGAAVQNGRKIDEPSPCPDVGNVPAPLTSRFVSGEVTPEQVRAPLQVLGRHGGSDVCPWLRVLQPQVAHDGADRRTAGPHTTPLQDHLDSPVSVGAIGVLKNVLNQDGQLLPPDGRLRLGSVALGVVP